MRDTQGADVVGPIGRVFNRILGLSDNAKGTAGKKFNREQIKGYLDNNLKLAEDEWFRGKKLNGVADKLMETLDTDKDGFVGWPEFQAFQGQVLSSLAPGAKAGDDPAKVGESAGATFDSLDVDRGNGGRLTYDEIKSGAKSQLPKDTEHADLIAQLGARIALDAVDTDQRKTKITDRTLSKDEWTTAASEMASSG